MRPGWPGCAIPHHRPPPVAERDHAGVIFAMSDIVLSLAAIVTLGYIGLGIQPPTPDWGDMIAAARTSSPPMAAPLPRAGVVMTGLGPSPLPTASTT